MIRKFNPPGVSAPDFYSHAAEVTQPARTLYIAGQVGVRPDGSVGEGIGGQTRIAIENLKRVLAAADMDVSNVAKYTIYLTDQSQFDGFVAEGAPLISLPPPPTTLVYVKALASPAFLIEIEAVAAK